MSIPDMEDVPRFAPIIGRAMHVLRDRAGLSQERLVQRVPCSRETVRRLEGGGETTTAMIDQLLRAMNYTADDLLNELQATRAKLNGKHPRSAADLTVVQGNGSGDKTTKQVPLVVTVP